MRIYGQVVLSNLLSSLCYNLAGPPRGMMKAHSTTLRDIRDRWKVELILYPIVDLLFSDSLVFRPGVGE